MKKFVPILMSAFCLNSAVAAQTNLIPIEHLDSLMLIEKKLVLILLSTEWCKYCQMQKHQLRKNRSFLKQADSFYYVVFDAEKKDPVTFHHKKFYYKPAGMSSGIHELAVALNGSENTAFPTWVVLNKEYQVVFRRSEVLTPAAIQDLLKGIRHLQKTPDSTSSPHRFSIHPSF